MPLIYSNQMFDVLTFNQASIAFIAAYWRPNELRKGFNPPILPQAELSAAEAGGRAKNGGHLQAMYSSATSQLDGLFEYLSSSLPALDMNAWTTCLNSGDQRSDLKEFGMSPKTRRRPVVRA